MAACTTPTHHRVLDRVHQPDDVGSSPQVFQDFDLAFDLLLLHGLLETETGDGMNDRGFSSRRVDDLNTPQKKRDG